MVRCGICGRDVKDIADHVKRTHKLSERSIRYLISLGVTKDRIEKLMLTAGMNEEEIKKLMEG